MCVCVFLPEMTFIPPKTSSEIVLMVIYFSCIVEKGEQEYPECPHKWLLLGSGLAESVDSGTRWPGSNPDTTDYQLCDFGLRT